MAKIKALNVYPVKSCRGIPLQAAEVTASGFLHDREWMIVREGYRFITQREQPRLALIEPTFIADTLELRAPGVGSIRIPLAAEGEAVEAVCWRDRCAAFDLGAEPARWLSNYLQGSVRLVRFDPRGKRRSDPKWTQDAEAFSRFADAFPWLVISQASLDDLNTRLPAALPMNRFRPNIVLEDLPSYAEDRIHELEIGGVHLRLVKPCTRCAITTTDQYTAARETDEPLRTLRRYRFSRELKGVLFGQNAILLAGDGERLRVGQEIAVSWKSAAPGESAPA
jgi:uncharacterized protein YcbX